MTFPSKKLINGIQHDAGFSMSHLHVNRPGLLSKKIIVGRKVDYTVIYLLNITTYHFNPGYTQDLSLVPD